MPPDCKFLCTTFSKPAYYYLSVPYKSSGRKGKSPYDTHYFCQTCRQKWIPHEKAVERVNGYKKCPCCGNTLRVKSVRSKRKKAVYVIEEGVHFEVDEDD